MTAGKPRKPSAGRKRSGAPRAGQASGRRPRKKKSSAKPAVSRPTTDQPPPDSVGGEVQRSGQKIPFVDGATARRAANVTTRLDRPLPVVAALSRPSPGIDLEAPRKPRTPSLWQELRRVEPQMLRRWREQLVGPLVQAAARALDPTAHRRWIRGLAMQRRSAVVDDFGLDPVYAEHMRPVFEFLYRTYWRVEARGLEHVPDHGRTMVVARRSSWRRTSSSARCLLSPYQVTGRQGSPSSSA